MNNQFLIVVVIYECDFEDSLTLQRLRYFQQKASFSIEILIYDNSLQSRFLEEYLQGITYYKHAPENNGVAAAYNYALSLGKIKQKEWLVLFDQDTDISNDYFLQLEKSLNLYPHEKLFCPVVQSGNTIVSPTYYLIEKSVKPKKLKMGLVNSKYFTVINSGLAIQLKEFEILGGYDNDLPLDFSDHNFFRKYKKRNNKFVILNTVILHSLSSENETSFKTVYQRFIKYHKSAGLYSKKIHSLFPVLWLWVRTVKLTFKFNRFEFIKFILLKK